MINSQNIELCLIATAHMPQRQAKYKILRKLILSDFMNTSCDIIFVQLVWRAVSVKKLIPVSVELFDEM